MNDFPLPTMLRKDELRRHLGYPNQPIAPQTLRRRLLKDKIIDFETWCSIRTEQYFPPELTQAIYQKYKIEALKG